MLISTTKELSSTNLTECFKELCSCDLPQELRNAEYPEYPASINFYTRYLRNEKEANAKIAEKYRQSLLLSKPDK